MSNHDEMDRDTYFKELDRVISLLPKKHSKWKDTMGAMGYVDEHGVVHGEILTMIHRRLFH
jgi:hypothetical protein